MIEMRRYRNWFYAAALYNLCWGSVVMVAASSLAWQVVGMFVLVYAPAYWCIARYPNATRTLRRLASAASLSARSGARRCRT